MPSSSGAGCTVSVEDEDKLDAALAIAALSGGSWTSKPPGGGGPRARKTRASAAAAERRPLSPSSRRLAANGAAKKRTRLRDADRGSSTSPLTTKTSKLTVTDDHLTKKLARHSSQTNGQLEDASLMNKSPDPVYLIDNEPAAANQAGKLMVTDLRSVRIVPLTPLSPSGIFLSQSNDTLIDPQLMQVLMQQKQPLQFFPGSAHCLNSTGRLNPSALDSLKDNQLNPTSANCTMPLPGSLSTLRDYYINVPRTSSDTSNYDMPSSGSPTVVSQSNSAPNTSQAVVLNIMEGAVESLSPEVDDGNDEKELSLSQGTDAECIRPGFMLGKRSVSVVCCGDSNSSESGAVKMPGSLSILKQYYSSIGPNTRPRKTVSSAPRTFNDPELTFSKANAKTAATVSDETVLNLSKQYLGSDRGDESRISDVSDGDLMVVIHQNETMHLRADHKTVANSQLQTGMSLPVISVMQSPPYFSSSSSELSLKSQISANSLRILPEIKETNATPWASGQPGRSRPVQTIDSNISIGENYVCPENQRPLNISQTQLNNLRVLIGEELISLQEYMSRMNGSEHQPQTINLMQSEGLLCRQNLSSSSSSLFMPLNLSIATQSVEDQSDSLSCFSVVDDNSRGPVLLDREPDDIICMTPSNADCALLSDEVLNDDVGSTAASCTRIPSVCGRKGSYLDEEKKERSRSTHPILQSDDDGDLPLHIAVAHGKRDIVEHLTQMMNQMDATIDCRNHLRQTPLHLAVVTGDCDIVRLLLRAGASPNIADRNGQNCFHLSVQYHQTQCLQCLFTHCSESQPDIMNYEGMTALHLAVKLNRTDAIVVLLKNGARPDIVDGKSGQTPLYMAADTNQLKAAEILLALGASAQVVSYCGCSPVQAATAKSFDEMVKLLAKHGAASEQSSSSAESKQQ